MINNKLLIVYQNCMYIYLNIKTYGFYNLNSESKL